MSTTPTQGVKCAPTLDGVSLVGVEAESFEVARAELKGNHAAANGRMREQRLAPLPGEPEITSKWTFSIQWSHLGSIQEAVQARLAFPGQHRLCLWKHLETFGYLGDGSRSEFHLPPAWRIATHALVPPAGLDAAKFAPIVRVGFDGAALPVEHVASATYDADPTPAGSVWFELHTARFRLGTAPALDARLVVTVVPEILCVTAGEPESRQYRDPHREPRRVVLVEA
jgi:hypothetical protein